VESIGDMVRSLLILLCVCAASSLKIDGDTFVDETFIDADAPSLDVEHANMQVSVGVSQSGNATFGGAYDPLEPSEVITKVLEVQGRVYQSCTGGDYNARWYERSSKSSPNMHCYMTFLQEKTWFQARRSCENLGANLVTLTSEDEMDFVWRKFGSLFNETWKGPWMGFSDAQDEGSWLWVNGESGVVGQDTVYTNWYVGEPDDCCGGQDCASIAGGKWGYKWSDTKCHDMLPYICERNF